MTIQSKVSHPIEATSVRSFSWSLALAILILGILLGVLATNMSTAINKTGVADGPARLSRDFPARPNLLELEKGTFGAGQPLRALETEAARYSSLGQFYAAGNEVSGQHAIAAESARYNGLANIYGVKAGPILSTAGEVNLPHRDREYGLAAFEETENETDTLAWLPRPTQFVPLSK